MWGTVDLGDQRLNRRALMIGRNMTACPEALLPEQMKRPAALEGAYRLMNNPLVTLPALLAPSYHQTREELKAHEVALLVNDQTELDYTAQRGKTGLGPIGDGRGQGLLMHTTLAVLPDTRRVVGLSYVQVYLRQPAAKPRPKWVRTPEAQCWQNAATAIGAPPAGCIWVAVSDAGSDYFAYLAACRQDGKHFLVRVSRDRRLAWSAEAPQAQQAEAGKLLSYARSLPAQPGSETQIEVAARPHQPERIAQLVMAWAPITLTPSPQAPPEERQAGPLAAWVLRVWEPQPPAGAVAIEWILLSSLPVTTLAEARTRVDWYTCRWLCADFHQCLKTGCRVEDSQLSDRPDLENLLGFAAPIAVRLLQLRSAARQTPQTLAQHVVDPLMLQVLARLQQVDAAALTVETFWALVARLGGFQGRKKDGFPGWRTVWRGWRYLADLTAGARLVSDGRT